MKIVLLFTLLLFPIYIQTSSADSTNMMKQATDKIDQLRSNIAKAIAPKEKIVDQSIDQKYANLEWKTSIKELMPEWTGDRIFFLKNGQWIALLFIFFFAFLFEKISRIYVGHFVQLTLKNRGIDITDKKRKKITFPLGLMMMAAIWIFLIRFIELPFNILDPLIRAGKVIFTVATVLTALNAVNTFSLYFEKLAKESDSSFDDILVPLIRKTIKSFVVIVGAVYIGNSLTLDMKGIVAGLGLGGFAFALAAKDTISNIFGSVTVLLDRPFRIGDWILIDNKVEGTVVEVGLRSTKIRTFYDSIISLPNGSLTNVHIDNYGKRTYRRYTTKIGIQYDTPPEKIEAFCEAIRHLIINHKYTRKDYFHVYLNGLGGSSLDILLYVFWKVPDWSVELAERHHLLIDIIRLGKKLGVEFAFPTQTLHMYSEEKPKGEEIQNNYLPYDRGEELGRELANSSVTKEGSRSSSNL